MTGWRIPLRIARREAVRAKGRSILMLVMIALPVMGVTAADILIQTQNVNSVESLDRRLGTEAAARVTDLDVGNAVKQGIDPEYGGYGGTGATLSKSPTLESVLATLGGERRGIPVGEGYPAVKTDKGVTNASSLTIDVNDKLARGLYRLTGGRWPQNQDEVVVNQALADRGPGLGEDISIGKTAYEGDAADPEYVTRKVVGIAESTAYRDNPQLVGLPGSLPDSNDDQSSWLISGGPVGWGDVTKLNAIGTSVLSRSVVGHPSAAARSAEQMYNPSDGLSEETITLAVLVVVMALIEVVLLAGPAFAVGARRQSRPLALLAACGGTPGQARKVVLATGVVIGAVGAVVGVLLGVIGAVGLEPLLQRHDSTRFGPFEVPALHLLGIAAFGFVSALLAAVVPAWIASHQDVVAVLNGRRGDRKPSTRSPVLGVVLLVVGIVFAALSSEQPSSSAAILIGLSAISCVLGLVFVVPVVVVGVATLGRFLPLPLRFAVRDAARHRTRTTPAVAAVAATVMGVVALGIGVTSDDKRNETLYVPQLPGHAAAISSDGFAGSAPWDKYARVIEREAPRITTERVLGVPTTTKDGQSQELELRGGAGPDDYLYGSYNSPFSTPVLVYDGQLPTFLTEVDGFDADLAIRTLEAGGVVVFPDGRSSLREVTISVTSYDEVEEGAADSPQVLAKPRKVPATAMDLRGRAPSSAIIPVAVAKRLGVTPATVALVTTGPQITAAQQKDISEGLKAIKPGAYLYVERGYQQPSDVWIVQLVLAGLGALLMLGGTLTATFLALSDARPDLATLSAVGAAPRTRRFVAAGYSLSIGLVGAVLGAVVGFVPGIAATYAVAGQGPSCTSNVCATGDALRDHYLDVPWLLILGVVVALPLLTAAVVGLAARSRLPMVSRLA